MRLDKYLADMSFGTRSEVKDLIKQKRVQVNGEIIIKADYKVNSNDEVLLDNQIVNYVEFEYYLLNKPQGYVCANDDYINPTVFELITSQRKDLNTFGRLDKDTEGLIIISNDGQLQHQLMSGKKHVSKKYYFTIEEILPDNAKELLEKPMDLGDFVTKEASFQKIDNKSGYLTISEGKYHQVKRMLEKIGCHINYLQRVEFAFIQLDVELGKYRPLTSEEITKLKGI